MWVERYSCLAEFAVSFAQYFTMINPHPSLSAAAAATDAVSLIFLLYSRRLSNVVGFRLGVTFYGALLPPIRLLWTCWFVHMCRHSDPVTSRRDSMRTTVSDLFDVLDTQTLSSAWVRRMLPGGFGLHSSHIRRNSLGEREARSEMLTEQQCRWQLFKLPGMNLSMRQCFHIFLFLLWCKWVVPNIWITFSGILQSVEKAMANKNFRKLRSHF